MQGLSMKEEGSQTWVFLECYWQFQSRFMFIIQWVAGCFLTRSTCPHCQNAGPLDERNMTCSVCNTPQIEAGKKNRRSCPTCQNAGPLDEGRRLSNMTCLSLLFIIPVILCSALSSELPWEKCLPRSLESRQVFLQRQLATQFTT